MSHIATPLGAIDTAIQEILATHLPPEALEQVEHLQEARESLLCCVRTISPKPSPKVRPEPAVDATVEEKARAPRSTKASLAELAERIRAFVASTGYATMESIIESCECSDSQARSAVGPLVEGGRILKSKSRPAKYSVPNGSSVVAALS